MSNLVKPLSNHRRNHNRKLIVVAGRIVDGALQIACDPYWLAWQKANAPTCDYVPFQNVDPSTIQPAHHRSDYVGD